MQLKSSISRLKANQGFIFSESLARELLSKKDIRINGKCIGESAPSIYFYNELAGDTEHEISTESEFSPNKIYLPMLGGQNYFVENYITMGAFVGGANLRVIDESKGKAAVLKLKLAKQGNCMSAQ